MIISSVKLCGRCDSPTYSLNESFFSISFSCSHSLDRSGRYCCWINKWVCARVFSADIFDRFAFVRTSTANRYYVVRSHRLGVLMTRSIDRFIDRLNGYYCYY